MPLDLEAFSNNIQDLLGAGLDSPLSLFQPFRDLASSPAGISFQRRRVGRNTSRELRENLPDYDLPSINQPLLRIGNRQVGLQGIGQEALREREQAFSAGEKISQEQQDVTKKASSLLFQNLKAGEDLFSEVSREGNRSIAGLEEGIQAAKKAGQTAMAFTKAGIQASLSLIKEVLSSSGQIRKDFALDVSKRADAVSSGIRGAMDQNYAEHVRALESSGPVSDEERFAIRAMYDRDASRQIAATVGSLHEAAVEQRSVLETTLNQTTQTVLAGINQNISATLEGGAVSLRDTAKLIGDLNLAKAETRTKIALNKVSIQQFTSLLAKDGTSALFDMVSATQYPVLVFSDIMAGLFDMGRDIITYHNNIESQRYQDLITAMNPENAAIMVSLGGDENNRFMDQQLSAQRDASRNSMYGELGGALISGGSRVAAAGLA